MSVQFAVLASGSRGNSTLVCENGAGLLIDVGLGPKAIGERLESVGSSWARIAAVVLTHTHADHVDSATFGELARRGVAFHCHEAHRAELAADPGFQKLEAAALVRCYDDHPFLIANGLRLEPIALRHDGGPTFGFRIEAPAARRATPVCIGYIADTGCWSETMADSLTGVDLLGVEFNHDVAMQLSSKRPEFLIERNLSDDGHLSNRQGALLIEAVLKRSQDRAPRHVVLLHLSEQCNHPELALEAAREALRTAGSHADIHAARQTPAFPNLWIEPAPARSRVPGSPRSPRARNQPAQFDATVGATGLLRWESDEDSRSAET
jgi:phosphoribosyl 1,2-cyclic phosphodiesterase